MDSSLATAYARSAYPGLGISLERASTEPALRVTLELLDRIHQQAARRARRAGAGRYLEKTA
jgi:hypothetical protein